MERIIDAKDGVSSRVDSTRGVADNVNAFSMSFYDTDGGTVSNYSDTLTVDISLSSIRTGIGRTYQETINTQAKLRNKSVDE